MRNGPKRRKRCEPQYHAAKEAAVDGKIIPRRRRDGLDC